MSTLVCIYSANSSRPTSYSGRFSNNFGLTKSRRSRQTKNSSLRPRRSLSPSGVRYSCLTSIGRPYW